VKVAQIAHELGVVHVLEGSVRKAGNRIRVTAQLINASNGFHVWSERYDRELTDIFAVQDEITHAIAEVLRVKLSPQTAAPRRYEPNLRAYDAYLKARDLWFRRTTPEWLVRFRELLERAIELDPKFALASSFLGMYYTMQANLGFKVASEVIPLAVAAEKEALSVDPSLPDFSRRFAQPLDTPDWFGDRFRCRPTRRALRPLLYPQLSRRRRLERRATVPC
jgi:adenylate cyclase